MDFDVDIGFDPRDIERVVDELDAAMEDQVRWLAQGLRMLAETGMTDVKENWVPVRTGYLRSTGAVDDERVDNNFGKVEVVVGFSAHYARAVHENHPTKAKYLETPFMMLARTAERRLVQFMASRVS